MNILIISASPKKRFSTSLYLSNVLKLCFIKHQVKIIQLRSVRDYEEIKAQFPKMDAVLFAFPIYVDAIPSTLLDYLCRLTKDIGEHHYGLKVYGVNVCGFYEGHQCSLSLDMLKNWCVRTNLEWGGGIGIGAGEMLSILRLNIPLGLVITLIELILHSNSFFPVNLVVQTVVYILFSLGMFCGLFRLKNKVVRGTISSNIFTTVWFCPRFLFVGFASLYWVLLAFICHGVPVWKLFRKVDGTVKNP